MLGANIGISGSVSGSLVKLSQTNNNNSNNNDNR